MGLLDTLDGRTIDVRDAEARLRLRGSLRMILPVQTVDELDAWLRKYRSAADESGRRRGKPGGLGGRQGMPA